MIKRAKPVEKGTDDFVLHVEKQAKDAQRIIDNIVFDKMEKSLKTKYDLVGVCNG
jgi:hypothetical protein